MNIFFIPEVEIYTDLEMSLLTFSTIDGGSVDAFSQGLKANNSTCKKYSHSTVIMRLLQHSFDEQAMGILWGGGGQSC